MIPLPKSDAVHLLLRYKVAALYVVQIPERPNTVLVGCPTNIKTSLGWWQESPLCRDLLRGAPPDIATAVWRDKSAASRIVEAVTKPIQGTSHSAPLMLALSKSATTGVVAFAKGCPISRLQAGKQDIGGHRVQVKEDYRIECQIAIDLLAKNFETRAAGRRKVT